MAMVNPILTLANANVKDSRWLTLEVCREFQRNKCTRSDTECKFAHPPPHVEVQNGRVTACFDSIKGKCQRKDPPCKYLHPPQHLREQLLQNGRNNLILKNLQLQAAQAAFSQPIVPGLIPVTTNLVYSSSVPTLTTRARPEGHPYVGTAVPTSTIAFNPYLNTAVPAGALPTAAQTNGESTMLQQQTGVIQTAIPATQAKLARPDRLETAAIPGVYPYKRVAIADAKSGLPVYQPNANMATYQQLMQLQQQQYIPVTFAGHPPSVPRF
ncbi:hypothetical protein CHS0354_039623 [Potamilus streckersoni]|uniref:C3H1-type domain-containing protein n=1 Tax=Potamilus streckersoni TaxID=2493646 RepID=A0AAE0SVB6_9BIVA|nr:hypothetical protein CHS0354_039623 [Potamilus streckersoni]